MGLFFENYGLDDFYEDEVTMGMAKYTVKEGRIISGYSGQPDAHYSFGDLEMVVNFEKQGEGQFVTTGVDNHSQGGCIWNAVLGAIDLTEKGQHPMKRRMTIEGANGTENLTVVNLVHADVLPSFMAGDEVKMQIVGYPLTLELYENEEDYMDAQPEWRDGKLGLADGFIFPSGMLINRNPNSPDFEKDPEMDSYSLLRGNITRVLWGTLKFGEETIERGFLEIFVRTRIGELQLIWPHEKVSEEDWKLLKPGTICNATVYLSGDVAIYEYNEGFVLDEEHDLSLLRYSMAKGDPERLRPALAKNAVYSSELSGENYQGPDAIILRIRYVKENAEPAYLVEKGTITSIDDGEEILSYGVGTRCLILYAGDYDHPESLLFTDTDKDGKVTRILTTDNSRYHFRADEKPVLKEAEYDWKEEREEK